MMAMKVEDAPQVTIIKHPDVRRMLLRQKSISEGLRLLCLFCYFCMDNQINAMWQLAMDPNANKEELEKEKAYWTGMIEVLTPVVKAYSTDRAQESIELAVQCYGGYGFCREYPVEQMMRDNKINQIYEGTNGIQALDLLGRKLGMKKGSYFINLLNYTAEAISEAEKLDLLKEEAAVVKGALTACGLSAKDFSKMIGTTPYVPLIGACDYLNALGDAVVGWLHLRIANAAAKKYFEVTGEQDKNFYMGKIRSAKFFINRITGLVPGHLENIKKNEQSAMDITDEQFVVE